MQGWQTRLNERRRQFLSKSREKVRGIELLLDELLTEAADNDLLTKVNRQFHQMAGAGGIYEMTDFCSSAIAAEELCMKLLMNKSPVADIEQQKLRALCRLMFEALNMEERKVPADVPDQGLADEARKADILLVDQNSERLIAWHRIFEENKMAVRTVKTASGARGALLTRVPDVMVINGPLSDSPHGFEVVQQLRLLPNGADSIVLLMSEHADFKVKVEAIKCGANSFVETPTDANEVVIKIREMLGRRQPVQYRILSVEDDPEQAYFIKSTLESVGYAVLHIADPEEFEEALDSFAPHLVLLDIMLGDISGHDLARFVRKHDKYNKLPVVFLSTENQLNMHVESARVGGDEHLVKPISPQLLVAAIAGRLERS